MTTTPKVLPASTPGPLDPVRHRQYPTVPLPTSNHPILEGRHSETTGKRRRRIPRPPETSQTERPTLHHAGCADKRQPDQQEPSDQLASHDDVSKHDRGRAASAQAPTRRPPRRPELGESVPVVPDDHGQKPGHIPGRSSPAAVVQQADPLGVLSQKATAACVSRSTTLPPLIVCQRRRSAMTWESVRRIQPLRRWMRQRFHSPNTSLWQGPRPVVVSG
jgi:hypothetical protein